MQTTPQFQDTAISQERVTYRLVVGSPEEAVRTLRSRFGEDVEVISVRAVSAPGLKGMLGSRKFEVLARPAPKEEVPSTSSSASFSLPSEEEPEECKEHTEGLHRRMASPSLREVLKRVGFSTRSFELIGGESALGGGEQPTHRSLLSLADTLRGHFHKMPERTLPRRVAFLGSSSSGRTTALGKWLGRSVFQQGQRGHVYRLELDHPNRAEGLDLLCEALGLVLEHLGDGGFGDMPEASGDFELIHAPALSLSRPQENLILRDFLDRERVEGRVLVVNAVYDVDVQRAIVRAGRDLGATHLVFSHLDEVRAWGKLWDPILESRLIPLFLSTGPSLTGGLELKVVDTLLKKTIPGF